MSFKIALIFAVAMVVCSGYPHQEHEHHHEGKDHGGVAFGAGSDDQATHIHTGQAQVGGQEGLPQAQAQGGPGQGQGGFYPSKSGNGQGQPGFTPQGAPQGHDINEQHQGGYKTHGY